jgi:hypothetical protein
LFICDQTLFSKLDPYNLGDLVDVLLPAGFTLVRLPLLTSAHIAALGINMADSEALQRVIAMMTG